MFVPKLPQRCNPFWIPIHQPEPYPALFCNQECFCPACCSCLSTPFVESPISFCPRTPQPQNPPPLPMISTTGIASTLNSVDGTALEKPPHIVPDKPCVACWRALFPRSPPSNEINRLLDSIKEGRVSDAAKQQQKPREEPPLLSVCQAKSVFLGKGFRPLSFLPLGPSVESEETTSHTRMKRAGMRQRCDSPKENRKALQKCTRLESSRKREPPILSNIYPVVRFV